MNRRLGGPTARLALTAALLLGEVLLLTLNVNGDNLHTPQGLARFALYGAAGLRLLLTALLLTAGFGYLELRQDQKNLTAFREYPIASPAAAVLNLLAFAMLGYFSLLLFGTGTPKIRADLLTGLCAVSAVAMLFSAGLVFVPLPMWRRMYRAAPAAPAVGLILTAAIALLTAAVKPVWLPWIRLTFGVVRAGLSAVRSGVVADPAHFILGTGRFSVVISPECSGYEGIALMLGLGSAWLWFFRRDFVFPRALLLLPAGVAAMWVLNCLRIIALILIGDAGAPAIAAGGFHSEAGWISFIALSAGLLLAGQRIAWISATPAETSIRKTAPDQTAAYLAPFLAILAGGMIAHAASAGFEWLYPLRVVAAGAALGWFRRDYGRSPWRVERLSVAIGILAFIFWFILAGSPHQAQGMPPELRSAAESIRIGWLIFRVAGAAVTVPIAEELAFRGYLLRRLQSADFAAVDLRRTAFLPVALSSVIFGVLHGRLWLPGTIAGALYAMAARERGRLAGAAAAHAITNALLAGRVLLTGDWSLW